ncbi:MFS general substrate transporter [Macroventuria anomochaeta]|uniref:MFS general substrate transporter n=1 Tax=Macroventuria anomochaeta TaxID=301207 RepID=A0ACB6RJ97_9PLEO|nr:MFS general substrate transporter [Macroventuria anomochaeta]KAF2621971.1 MFS general substrate transporter [Macroventuria anomochaeta]
MDGGRRIIVINDILTVLTAFVVPFVLLNRPETASFLTEEDRHNLVLLRELEVSQAKVAQMLHKDDVKAAAKDWKTWASAIAQFSGLGMLYSFSVFLPTIIFEMGGGWDRQIVQALTIPVYFLGFSFYIGSAYYSDKIQLRGIFCVGGFLTYMVGPRYGKRAFASGMQITIGNAAGVSTPFLFNNADAPTYYPGYSATIAHLALSAGIYATLHFWHRKENKRKLEGKEDYRLEGLYEKEIAERREHNPRLFYMI